MATMQPEYDIYPDDYFDACDEHERMELRDLVCNHFNIPFDLDIVNAIMKLHHVSGLEAKELIRRTLEELEWKLKMRDFS